MYKNQLQELAQRSCFSLPSYTCIREGPDHAPRFKAVVNFNGESFESPHFCSNLRLAEHAAAEAALASLSSRGPSHSLAARILDETGAYKNLLQEIAQRVGSPLPCYTICRSGLGHLPVFTGIVELAGITFQGEPAKNKKQAEKNAALAAWLSLKQLAQKDAGSSLEHENNEEQEQIKIARALQNYRMKERIGVANSRNITVPFLQNDSVPTPCPSSPQRPPMSVSKILPLFCQKTASRSRPSSIINNTTSPRPPSPEVGTTHTQRYPTIGAAPYIPVNQYRTPYHGIAPPVTMRTAVPVFSAPPLPPPAAQVMHCRPSGLVPPVCIRQAVPVSSAPPALKPPSVSAAAADRTCDVDESTAIKCLEQHDTAERAFCQRWTKSSTSRTPTHQSK
ncbi:double-stranded RNA-binding protein 2-like isoform X1 [Salvia splendens]|uniref:double-stranded RNA-binding protein 2-like isoform X1 n=1 Tax=Salvia splendens TaxID=180675 RepID=UPI001C25B56D|nr:double-stranded RNA-binding protein 2-like isoform X1 [Salvia splendens]